MLKVIKSGFYSTIQDQGRFGYREYGVPVSGAMDAYSSRFANTLLGNDDNDAVLEMTMTGGTFQFSKPTVIAISGADMNPVLNEEPIKQNSIIQVNSNDVLSFEQVKHGFRTYLAIKKGFKSDIFLGSRSQYSSITSSNTITKGDIIDYNEFDKKFQKSNALLRYNTSIFSDTTLEAFTGPEFDKLTSIEKDFLFNTELVVSKYNNRMAYRLEPLIENDLESILTSPLLPGTVQLTPKGNLIVLMRDCQTTGGYPRILQLAEKSINILSQKLIGNSFKFRLKD